MQTLLGLPWLEDTVCIETSLRNLAQSDLYDERVTTASTSNYFCFVIIYRRNFCTIVEVKAIKMKNASFSHFEEKKFFIIAFTRSCNDGSCRFKTDNCITLVTSLKNALLNSALRQIRKLSNVLPVKQASSMTRCWNPIFPTVARKVATKQLLPDFISYQLNIKDKNKGKRGRE